MLKCAILQTCVLKSASQKTKCKYKNKFRKYTVSVVYCWTQVFLCWLINTVTKFSFSFTCDLRDKLIVIISSIKRCINSQARTVLSYLFFFLLLSWGFWMDSLLVSGTIGCQDSGFLLYIGQGGRVNYKQVEKH